MARQWSPKNKRRTAAASLLLLALLWVTLRSPTFLRRGAESGEPALTATTPADEFTPPAAVNDHTNPIGVAHGVSTFARSAGAEAGTDMPAPQGGSTDRTWALGGPRPRGVIAQTTSNSGVSGGATGDMPSGGSGAGTGAGTAPGTGRTAAAGVVASAAGAAGAWNNGQGDPRGFFGSAGGSVGGSGATDAFLMGASGLTGGGGGRDSGSGPGANSLNNGAPDESLEEIAGRTLEGGPGGGPPSANGGPGASQGGGGSQPPNGDGPRGTTINTNTPPTDSRVANESATVPEPPPLLLLVPAAVYFSRYLFRRS